MSDRQQTVRRIRFLAQQARSQNVEDIRATDIGHPDPIDSAQTVGVSEVSLLIDLPRLHGVRP